MARLMIAMGVIFSMSARAQNDLIWNTDFQHPDSPATSASDLPFTTNVTHEGVVFEFTTEFVGTSIPDPRPVSGYAQTLSTYQLLSMEATQGGVRQCLRTTMEVVNSDLDFDEAFFENLEFVIEDVDIGGGTARDPTNWQDVVLLEGLYQGSAVPSNVTLGGSDVQQRPYTNGLCNRLRVIRGYEIDTDSGNARCFRGAGSRSLRSSV